jgi:type II secretory pathway pseudopilin PulG
MEKNVKIAGVSIIEILIAMFLVAIALFTIATLFPRMGAHRKSIHEADQAKLIAMEVLEGLQMLSEYEDYGGCASGFGAIGSDYNNFRDKFTIGQTIGAVIYTVTDFPDMPNCDGDFNTVTVNVNWDKSGKPHKIAVTGVIR